MRRRDFIAGLAGTTVGWTPTARADDLPQKAVLREEDPGNSAGKSYVGTTVWRTEAWPGQAQKPNIAARADVVIPAQNISIRWLLRRNDDKQLPASYIIEIVFTLPPDFPHGGISNVPGMLTKQGETMHGEALSAVAVKIGTTNSFLIGLPSADAEIERNVKLLLEASWFEIPMVYGDGKHAIIAVEIGTPGERSLSDAIGHARL